MKPIKLSEKALQILRPQFISMREAQGRFNDSVTLIMESHGITDWTKWQVNLEQGVLIPPQEAAEVETETPKKDAK